MVYFILFLFLKSVDMVKIVLIIGSSSGIGFGIVCFFVEVGYNFVFNGLEDNGVEIVVGVVLEFGIEVYFFFINLMDFVVIRKMVEEVKFCFGGVDVLVNNVGVQYVVFIEEFLESKWDFIFGVNFSVAFYVIKVVWLGM